jgi:hypothetical protein
MHDAGRPTGSVDSSNHIAAAIGLGSKPTRSSGAYGQFGSFHVAQSRLDHKAEQPSLLPTLCSGVEKMHARVIATWRHGDDLSTSGASNF